MLFGPVGTSQRLEPRVLQPNFYRYACDTLQAFSMNRLHTLSVIKSVYIISGSMKAGSLQQQSL